MHSKNHMDRRTFIKTSALGGASMALSAGVSATSLAAEDSGGSGSQKIPTRLLGKTGVSIPILGVGGIDWTTNQSLLRMARQMGIAYWDTAPIYDNGKSELGIGQYLAKYPEDRKDIFLVTKASRANGIEDVNNQFAQSLERMETDHIDLYMMHGLQEPSGLTPELKAWAEQKKKEGKIKFFGFSTHANMAQMLQAAPSMGVVDAVMTTYNYNVMTGDDMNRGMDAIAEAGIGFIAMKSQGMGFGGPPGGQSDDLTAVNHFMEKGYTLEQAKLKAVWEDERVTAILSGISNLTILKDNVAAASDGVKLSALDRKVLTRLAADMCGGYCHGCMRCEAAMASGTRIPDVLRYMMYYNSYREKDEAKTLFRQLPGSVRTALASGDFSRAERACPNGIQIGKAMKEAVRLLG